MDIRDLKKAVVEANKELPKHNLVKYSWGNVGAIDRERGVIVIKPVGMPYDELTVENISVTDLEGIVLEGPYNPSVDLPIHVVLFKAFPQIQAIVHTHSTYATMWAQAGRDIPCYGTTHADYYYRSIPCTRQMSDEEIHGNFEVETGNVIVERFKGIDPMAVPGVLVASHGAFTWGTDVWDAVHKSVVLEEIAKMALGTTLLNPQVKEVPMSLMERHFSRKHGPGAYFENDDYGRGIVNRR
ncbi:MAG: L-ribulose-5-phosphate 4-epimerase AraD [Tenuifilaceae bacterium]|jgi:L-ribulose-5-phosphate 4-epimerase|nr:L-ribulose-5-phosphate 4-epimerase AraD [Tenuifilaceae bacterium]